MLKIPETSNQFNTVQAEGGEGKKSQIYTSYSYKNETIRILSKDCRLKKGFATKKNLRRYGDFHGISMSL